MNEIVGLLEYPQSVTPLTINDDYEGSWLFFQAITRVLVIRHKTVNNYITGTHRFINN